MSLIKAIVVLILSFSGAQARYTYLGKVCWGGGEDVEVEITGSPEYDRREAQAVCNQEPTCHGIGEDGFGTYHLIESIGHSASDVHKIRHSCRSGTQFTVHERKSYSAVRGSLCQDTHGDERGCRGARCLFDPLARKV